MTFMDGKWNEWTAGRETQTDSQTTGGDGEKERLMLLLLLLFKDRQRHHPHSMYSSLTHVAHTFILRIF